MDTQNNQTIVSFTLDRVGAKRFGKATSTGIGKQLAIVLDGKIISAPVVRDTIASGSGQISGIIFNGSGVNRLAQQEKWY